MALSNMRREPRREITEQAIGLIFVGTLLIGPILFGNWLHSIDPSPSPIPAPVDWLLGVIAEAVATIALIGGWYLAHTLGEVACDLMAAAGFDPRPKQRY